jgi:hypothetical protein
MLVSELDGGPHCDSMQSNIDEIARTRIAGGPSQYKTVFLMVNRLLIR